MFVIFIIIFMYLAFASNTATMVHLPITFLVVMVSNFSRVVHQFKMSKISKGG